MSIWSDRDKEGSCGAGAYAVDSRGKISSLVGWTYIPVKLSMLYQND
jgi:hypothetical protein